MCQKPAWQLFFSCEVLKFFPQNPGVVRLDRQELIKEPSQFKPYSIGENAKAKCFYLTTYYFSISLMWLNISIIFALFQEQVKWKRRKFGLRVEMPILSTLQQYKRISVRQSNTKANCKVKHIYQCFIFFQPFFKSRTKITHQYE